MLLSIAFVLALEGGPGGPAAQSSPQSRIRVPGSDLILQEGWQLLSTVDRRCIYVVPASWQLVESADAAQSPDARSWVAAAALDVAQWSAHRRAILQAAPAVVHEDTSRRLWVERSTGARVWHHIATSDGQQACDIDVVVPNPPAVDLRTIVNSIRPTPQALIQPLRERP